ncbi:MAG: hypothetical protein K2Y09_05230 [Nitrosomonas sp.]|uniref:hypothetical protein n=1 Tax=Nitrosomonas sp. TaxID=42353 RepID=UPI001D5C7B5D|nr:hypothetical protein [Nitrosomonas sp.]MBX9894569.1 hypothetical protein [Nitrosomonas sp.]
MLQPARRVLSNGIGISIQQAGMLADYIEKQRFEVKKWPGGIRGRMAMRERPELCYQP